MLLIVHHCLNFSVCKFLGWGWENWKLGNHVNSAKHVWVVILGKALEDLTDTKKAWYN